MALWPASLPPPPARVLERILSIVPENVIDFWKAGSGPGMASLWESGP